MTNKERKKEYKFDLFKEILPALHKNDVDFYGNLTEEQQKEISPVVLMRWMSLVDNEIYHTIMTNELVNIDFWDLVKHPELQWKLLALVGDGKKPIHKWVPKTTSSSKTEKLDKILLKLNSGLNKQELDIIKKRHNNESLTFFLKSLGMDDNQIKEIITEFKKAYS